MISSTFLEITLMVLGFMAVAFIIGDGIGVVSAQDPTEGMDIPGVDPEAGVDKPLDTSIVSDDAPLPQFGEPRILTQDELGKIKIELSENQKLEDAGRGGPVEISATHTETGAGTDSVIKITRISDKTSGGYKFAYASDGKTSYLQRPGETIWRDSTTSKPVNKKTTDAINAKEAADAKKAATEGNGKAEGFKLGEGFLGNLAEGVVWAFYAVTAIQMVGGIAGLESGETKSLSLAAASGIIVGKALYGILESAEIGQQTTYTLKTGATRAQFWSFWAGVGVAAYVLYETYEKEGEEIAIFSCNTWKPPKGGDNCEACNENPWRPCTEYRCRSLGSTCEIVNAGTEEEKCVNINPNDVNSPTIEPWVEALKPTELQYTNVNLRPPSLGMQIVRGGDSCLKAYTPLEFGLTTNEPAYCKVSYNRTKSFEDMQFDFGGTNFYLYNHTHRMLLPSPNEEDYDLGPILQNDGTFTLFVRCEDKNGNSNEDEFAINFCVDPSPDTTPPIIVDTSISSGSPVQFGIGNALVGVFVNEPAECRWSRDDRIYGEMEYNMECSTNPTQVNADMNYVCLANLTAIQDMKNNTYYFRCKDQPNKNESSRNVMVQSKAFELRGSQPLYIIEQGPNETISGNTDSVLVELTATTDDGADEGEADCFFSESGENETYIQFFETGSVNHVQELELPAGSYNYYIRCIDAGGNGDEKLVNFEVEVDRVAPFVARAYRDDGLKIVTSEDAECVYSISDCNYVFDEGLSMEYSNPSIKTNHFTEWKAGATYYIKCRDEFGNEPSPNSCSLEVSTFELS